MFYKNFQLFEWIEDIVLEENKKNRCSKKGKKDSNKKIILYSFIFSNKICFFYKVYNFLFKRFYGRVYNKKGFVRQFCIKKVLFKIFYGFCRNYFGKVFFD